MASKNYNNNNTPPAQAPNLKYMNDFSKALAVEVRILLEEVGKLRDERRQLQYEIAELMSVKSKHGAGGEYAPGWHPKIEDAPPEPAAPPPPAIEDAPAQARPGWRVVHKRLERKGKPQAKITAAPAAAPPTPMPEPPRHDMPAWTQWRPNPLIAPVAPPTAPAPSSPPPRSGLFGPQTPPPK